MGLNIGDKVPFFTAKNSDGTNFEIKNYIGQPIVIYFYPKDDTRICTQQACSFRDSYEDFKNLGAEVIGISSDSISSHKKFSKKHQLPFVLLSDEEKKLRKLFGVPNDLLGLIPGRVTYVIDKKGIIVLIFNSMSGTIHVEKALEIVKNQ